MSDREAVEAVAKAYCQATVTGDEAGLRKAFKPRSSVIGNFDGQFQWESLDAFVNET